MPAMRDSIQPPRRFFKLVVIATGALALRDFDNARATQSAAILRIHMGTLRVRARRAGSPGLRRISDSW
jgi:hypothetical protein